MSRVVWTRTALANVRRWHDFLQEKNPDAAQRAIKLVRGSIKIISSHPEAGRPIAEMMGHPLYRPRLYRGLPLQTRRGADTAG